MRNAFIGLAILTVMQVAVVLLLYSANLNRRRYRLYYFFAILLGFASASTAVFIFKHMDANIAEGMITGAPFLSCQLALAWRSKTRLSPRRLTGIAVLVTGLFLLGYFKV